MVWFITTPRYLNESDLSIAVELTLRDIAFRNIAFRNIKGQQIARKPIGNCSQIRI